MLNKVKLYFAINTLRPTVDIKESCGVIAIFASRDSAARYAGDGGIVVDGEYEASDLRATIMDVARKVMFENGKAVFTNPKSAAKALAEPTTTIDDFQHA